MKPLSLALAAGLTLGLLAPLASGKSKPPPTKEELERKAANTPVVGTVLKVEGKNITIQTRGKNAGEVKVETDTKTVFELNDAIVTIDKVKPGMELAALPNKGVAKKVAVDDLKKKKKTPTPPAK